MFLNVWPIVLRHNIKWLNAEMLKFLNIQIQFKRLNVAVIRIILSLYSTKVTSTLYSFIFILFMQPLKHVNKV